MTANEARADAVERGARPAPACRTGRGSRGAWLRLRVDLRSLPSVARRARPFTVRVGGARCDRRADERPRRRRRCDLPDDAHPPGHPRPGLGDRRQSACRGGSRGASAAARRSTSTSPEFAGRPLRSGCSSSKRRSPSSASCGAARSVDHDGTLLLRRGRADLRPAGARGTDRRVGVRPRGSRRLRRGAATACGRRGQRASRSPTGRAPAARGRSTRS